MKTGIIGLAALLIATTVQAQDAPPPPQAVCTVPVAPAPYAKPDLPPKPAVPSCLNMKTHISTCSKAVLDKYNTGIEVRNAALSKAVGEINDYIDALNKFNRANGAYNSCEIDRMNTLFKDQ